MAATEAMADAIATESSSDPIQPGAAAQSDGLVAVEATQPEVTTRNDDRPTAAAELTAAEPAEREFAERAPDETADVEAAEALLLEPAFAESSEALPVESAPVKPAEALLLESALTKPSLVEVAMPPAATEADGPEDAGEDSEEKRGTEAAQARLPTLEGAESDLATVKNAETKYTLAANKLAESELGEEADKTEAIPADEDLPDTRNDEETESVLAGTDHEEVSAVAPAVRPPGPRWIDLAVEPGAKPGELLCFKDMDGQSKCAIVPSTLVKGSDGRPKFSVQMLHGVVLQSQQVKVPKGAAPGSEVSFPGFCNLPKKARVPVGAKPGDSFPVLVPVPQPFPVIVPEGSQPGQELIFHGPDGRPHRSVVPPDVPPGQAFVAMLEPVPVAPVEALQPLDLKPWLEAARAFKMNTDFEVMGAEKLGTLDFAGLMKAMKEESAGKLTIQALSDKIFLSRMLDNMGMPQMPLLLELRDPSCIPEEVSRFVDNCCAGTHPGSPGNDGSQQEFIVKPTHLSNGEGVVTIHHVTEAQKEDTTRFLESHLKQFMDRSAQEFESQALQSLRPGFIVQPKYRSCVDFPMPLELRVVTMWGRARMGVWWWGPPGRSGCPAQRNAWFVRHPAVRGELSDQDRWEAVHEHHGVNPGFETGLRHFLLHMPTMAATAEHLAVVVGAPFLRVDFFVGSPEWGVRLNEVAYGSGTQHRRPSDAGGMLLVDDSHAMAQILREGMAQCTEKLPADHFLSRLGARGSDYAELSVEALPEEERLRMPEGTLQVSAEGAPASGLQEVPKNLCATMVLKPPLASFAPHINVAARPAANSAAPQENCSKNKPLQRPGRRVLSQPNTEKLRKPQEKFSLNGLVTAVNRLIGVPEKKRVSRRRQLPQNST